MLASPPLPVPASRPSARPGAPAPAASAIVPAAARTPSAAALALLLVAVLLALLGPLGATAALADPPREVSVVDDADVLNDGPLADRLKEVDFRKSVKLVVVTLDVTALGQSASSDIALNDAILELARREHPEWLRSSDGMKWADGTVLIVIDPTNRKLGTYAGEDVKLSDDQYQSVQDAMRDHARDAAWDDAMVDGAQKYASLLGRPWYMNPALIAVAVLTALVAGILVLTTVIGFLWRRSNSRQKVAAARQRYDDVMLHYAETELAARTIPLDSPYGEPILQDYESFRKTAARATTLHNQLPQRPSFGWGASPATAKLAKEYAEAVAKIDAMDDEIVATNDLLNRSNAWYEAWQREVKPVQASLDQVEEAVGAEPELADAPTARALREVASTVEAGLRTTTTDLQNDRIRPDEALAELDRMTDALSRASAEHRDAIIAARSRSKEEARVMRRAGSRHDDDGFGSIRQRRRHYHRSAYPDYWSISPLLYFSSWNSSARSDLETFRNPPSTSSSSGYSSSSSGGFSGSGSSSSF